MKQLLPIVLLFYIHTTFTQTPEMIYIQGGTFTMGCTSEQEPDCNSNESPGS